MIGSFRLLVLPMLFIKLMLQLLDLRQAAAPCPQLHVNNHEQRDQNSSSQTSDHVADQRRL